MSIKKTLLSFIIVIIFTCPLSAIAAEIEPNWFVSRSASNQDSTAYLSTPSKRPADQGYYALGRVAVHPDPQNKVNPIIPFGTTIFLTSPNQVIIQGNAYSNFKVRDIGDKAYVKSLYWIDIYFGLWDGSNENDPDFVAAKQWGIINKVSYAWDEYVN